MSKAEKPMPDKSNFQSKEEHKTGGQQSGTKPSDKAPNQPRPQSGTKEVSTK